jgi:NAD(P)-dependent dehydrogenase (short-subunit alcohol dehydrogenase family)
MMGNKAFKVVSFLVIPVVAIIATYFAYLSTNDLARFMHQPFNAEDIARMSTGKVIVVTGANSGLGLSSAKLLAEAGTARAVIMACRNMKKCHEAKEHILSTIGSKNVQSDRMKLIPAELDLVSLSSIRNFASNLQNTLRELETQYDNDLETKQYMNTPKIDVLLNNAGIMGVEYALSNDTNIELHMHVNHLGHFALTSLLRDNLMQGGRVVSVSSLVGALPLLNLNDVNWVKTPRAQILKHSNMLQAIISYSASKRANLVFTHAINAKFSSMGITAVAAHPGYTRSSIMHNGWVRVPRWLKDFVASNKVGSMSCDDGALSQLRAALDVENVKPDKYVAPLFGVAGRPVIVGSSMMSFHHLFWPIRGQEVEEELWKWSEDAIGWTFHNDASELVGM